MNKLKTIVIKAVSGVAILSAVGGFIYGSAQYAGTIGLFELERISVDGNEVLTGKEILGLAGVEFGTSLFELPLDLIQRRIEENPFVLSAQASRQFPRTLFISVKEREPIAYLNLGGQFLCVDKNRFVMPLPPSRGMGLPLPIFSGFSKTDSIGVDEVSNNTRLNQMVDVLTEIERDYPSFHRQISELIRTSANEFTIYTAESATKIFLGENNLSDKIRLLAVFWQTLGDRRTWNDYEYIDLRYRKQVIVHERT